MTTSSSPELETREARLRLPVSKGGVSAQLKDGVRLNYRRAARKGASGTWSILLNKGNHRGATMRRIAAANDYAAADGVDVMDFQQAKEAALAIAAGKLPAPTARARFSAADVARALMAAKAAGVAVRIEIAIDGSMNIIMLTASAQKNE